MAKNECWVCGYAGSAVPTKTLIGTTKLVCASGTGCSAHYARLASSAKAKRRKLIGRR